MANGDFQSHLAGVLASGSSFVVPLAYQDFTHYLSRILRGIIYGFITHVTGSNALASVVRMTKKPEQPGLVSMPAPCSQ